MFSSTRLLRRSDRVDIYSICEKSGIVTSSTLLLCLLVLKRPISLEGLIVFKNQSVFKLLIVLKGLVVLKGLLVYAVLNLA